MAPSNPLTLLLALLFLATLTGVEPQHQPQMSGSGAGGQASYRPGTQFNPSSRMQCPSSADTPHCDCTEQPQGLVISCNSVVLAEVTRLLGRVEHHIHSLSIASLSPDLLSLPGWFLSNMSVAELSISRSNIKEVDEEIFNGLEQNLVKLSIQESRLTYVPRGINKISSLRRLDLEGNNITELYPYSFYGASITSLSLSSNRLSGLTENAFLGLEGNLRTLSLSSNRIRNFPSTAVKNLQNLETLKLASNKIEEIASDSSIFLMSLRELDLSSNRFVKIMNGTLQAVPKLRSLILSQNRIKELEAGAFDLLEELELLQIDQNRLVTIPSGTFRHNRRLRTLVLSHNHLRQVNGLLCDLPSLIKVDLSFNFLLSISNTVFSGSDEVRSLYLQHNVLYEVADDAFKPLKKLNELHLSHNFLSRVSEQNFQHNIALANLNLENNMLRSLEDSAFQGVPRLRKLDLRNNMLREIGRNLFSGQAALTELSLEGNKLTDISPHAFSSLSSLKYLGLQGNRLPELADIMMRYPSSLVQLHLEDNRLVKFNENSFSGQTSLELIQMGSNRIQRIGAKIFFELINLFRLSATNNRIEDIEDKAFEHCVQLRFLDLSFNKLRKLTKLTLLGLNQLEDISLKENRIETIEKGSFQSLHHLKKLDLSYNKLEVLGEGIFHGCRAVHTLLLHHGSVQKIEQNALKPFSSLSRLDLSYNSLSDIEAWKQIELLTKLQVFQLSGNNLKNISSTITLQQFPHLVEIEIKNSKITDLNPHFLADNKELKVVRLDGNYISRLEIEFFSKQVFLRELHLGSNHFTSVPGSAMKYLYNLKLLDLSGNLFTELDDSSFDDVTGLTNLDISNNLISLLSNRVFHNITLLETLNLEGNRLSDFPSSTFIPLTNLRHVNIGRNQLQHIPIALQGLRQVTSMNLTRNSIIRLKKVTASKGVMATLTRLVITKTNMQEVDAEDFSLCPNLIQLDLCDNVITIVRPSAFMSQSKLEWLDLSGNRLIRLPGLSMQGMASLRTFNLSGNKLSLLDIFPWDLAKLQILDMSFNEIRSLDQKVFHHLENLVKLNLKGNKISQVSHSVFLAEQPLKGLDLRQNNLEKLPYEAIDVIENSLEALHVEDNPLVCSCRSYHQKLWLRQNRRWLDPSKKNTKVGPQCAQPETLTNRFLLTTKDEELCPLPSVSTFDIRNVTTSSVLIAWDSKDNNMTGLKGFLVAYHRLDMNDVVKKFKVNPSTRMFRLNGLTDNSVYLVCVITQGSSYTDYSLYSEFAEAIRLDEDGDSEDLFPYSDQHVLNEEMAAMHEPQIPSSNDTRYLITKPIVLNLDSKSSRCNKIKTPLDPSKMRMIDNKQLSAIIGCSSGLMVFFCIIISIIVAKPKRDPEDEVIVPKPESLAHNYQTPSPKSRKESLPQGRKSFSTSPDSSLNRRVIGMGSQQNSLEVGDWKGSTGAVAKNGTLKKTLHGKQTPSPHGRRTVTAQSSLESGPPSQGSNRRSRHSSSEQSGREGQGRKRGGSTEQLSREGRGGGNRLSQHLESEQYEQHTFPRGQRGRSRGGTLERGRGATLERDRSREEGVRRGGTFERGRSREEGIQPPPPRRYGYNISGDAEDCIPMIEYPDMSNSNHASPQTLRVPRPNGSIGGRGRGGRPRQRGRGRGGLTPPPPQVLLQDQGVDYYPMEGGTGNGYIKYNSMARY